MDDSKIDAKMRKIYIKLFCSYLVILLITGCVPLYDKYIIYYVPSWEMYVKLKGAENKGNKVLFSHNYSEIIERNEEQLDFIFMSDSYLRGDSDFIIVHKNSPDTLFVMSDNYNSISFPIKSINLDSPDKHFIIEGSYYKIEDGYFGFCITRDRWWKTKLQSFPSNETGWVLIPVTRNCLWL